MLHRQQHNYVRPSVVQNFVHYLKQGADPRLLLERMGVQALSLPEVVDFSVNCRTVDDRAVEDSILRRITRQSDRAIAATNVLGLEFGISQMGLHYVQPPEES